MSRWSRSDRLGRIRTASFGAGRAAVAVAATSSPATMGRSVIDRSTEALHYSIMDDAEMPPAIRALIEEAGQIAAEIKALLPDLVNARRDYVRSASEEHRQNLDEVQSLAHELGERHKVVLGKLLEASGLPEELFEELDREQLPGDAENRVPRESLVSSKVEPSAWIEDYLSNSLDDLLRLVDPAWLKQDPNDEHRLVEIHGGIPLSIVRGTRRKSEFPTVHRFLQAIRVAQDFLTGHMAYDHFGGALLLPQIAQLGAKLSRLRDVKGDLDSRFAALWRGPSDTSDSVAFELLVAAGCVEKGRRLEFIPPTSTKTPDLRCHDPFPLVIECKRQRALSDYELTEEAHFVELFRRLDSSVRKRGVWGVFDLALSVDIDEANVDEVVASLVNQRLAPRPDRPLRYPWGSVAYHELPRRFSLPAPTRSYSPNMLSHVFGWNADVPEWDGLVCKVDLAGQAKVDEIMQAVGLRWGSHSDRAIRKRSWSPMNLFGDAMSQIPGGEFGIVYVAYQEGTTAKIADLRVESFKERARAWYHSASIRVPISFLIRLYPRAFGEGLPDLIESTIRYYADYADPMLFRDFPSCVFSRPEAS